VGLDKPQVPMAACPDILVSSRATPEKLAYLSSLRDVGTGRYQHDELAAQFDPDAVDDFFNELHSWHFSYWLSLTTVQHCDELRCFAQSLAQQPMDLARAWLRQRTFDRFLPGDENPAQRDLYFADFRISLSALARGLSEAGRGDPERSIRDRRVAALARALRERRTSSAPTVKDLAQEAGVSASHLRRLTQESVGLSPKQFIMVSRMKEAARLLRNSAMSVKGIATKLGYGHSSNLSHDFRALFSRTPRDYRKRCSDRGR